MIDLAREVLRLATLGLQGRGLRNEAGEDEAQYLAPLHALVHMGASQAELLVKRFGDDAVAARAMCSDNLWEFAW